jgi:hypothetical protein
MISISSSAASVWRDPTSLSDGSKYSRTCSSRTSAVDRTASGCDPLRHVRAARFSLQRALDGIHLPAQPPHPIDQTPLVAKRAWLRTLLIVATHGFL